MDDISKNTKDDTPKESDTLVESNFRVYSYVRNGLSVDILSLFSAIKYRLPNLVVSQLTREAVRSGFGTPAVVDTIFFEWNLIFFFQIVD